MKYNLFALLLLGQAGLATGQEQPPQQPYQQPYQPSVPQASVGVYGGYGGGGGRSGAGSTAAGSAMAGMGQVINAAGNYNLSTSAAAVNMTQAQRNAIQNRQMATDTYFQMRQENRAARAQERGPPPTAEQLARIAHQGVPKSLKPDQVDQVSGHVSWPGPLQQDIFADDRAAVDPLVRKKSTYGSLSYNEQIAIRKALNEMARKLKGEIRSIPPQDYINSKQFINSLMYATTQKRLG